MDKQVKVIIEAGLIGATLGAILPMNGTTTLLAICLGFIVGMKGPFIL